MGKDKEQKAETPGSAFSRMNYLYQAAELMARTCNSTYNPLSNYYNKILKEISKKVLEKLHPDLKRTICCACNYPLTSGSDQLNVKIKGHKKKRKKRFDVKSSGKTASLVKNQNVNIVRKYSKTRIEVRNKKPNTICWSCCKCGFTKKFLQKPSYKLWIHEVPNSL